MAIALALLPAAAAHAENGYEARLVSQSPAPDPGVRVESGQLVQASVVVKNVGNRNWQRQWTRLAPTSPREHRSVFANETWLDGNRAAKLNEEIVNPDERGTFNVTLRAPGVTESQVVKDWFAPVRETSPDKPGGWMDGTDKWPDKALQFKLFVVPPAPPSVRIDSAVESGSAVTVNASASDNIGVTSVTIEIDGAAPVVLTAPPYTASIPTAGLSGGENGITVTAADASGRSRTAEGTVNIVGSPNGSPAGAATLVTNLSTRYGKVDKPAILTGRLTTADGATPIAGAAIEIAQRERRTGATKTKLVPVTTDATGNFTAQLPPGPSREFTVGYRAFTLQDGLTVSAEQLLRVKARPKIKLPKRFNSPGRLRVRGSLDPAYVPARGVVVVLQGKQRGSGWRTFASTKTRKSGKFVARYRFSQLSRSTRFKIRAVVRQQGAYPFALGRSKARTVTVTR